LISLIATLTPFSISEPTLSKKLPTSFPALSTSDTAWLNPDSISFPTLSKKLPTSLAAFSIP